MFYDVPRISYRWLQLTVENTKPYRGSTNAYPLGDRKYSNRHFRANDDGTFDICYTDRQSMDEHLKGVQTWPSGYTAEQIASHIKWRDARRLATVHPDNTIEIHNLNGQGDNGLLTELTPYTFQQVGSMGGVVAHYHQFTRMHPVFKGIRLSLDNECVCTTPYTTVQRKLNRKKATEAMKPYEEFHAVYPVMMRVMDERALLEVHDDVVEDAGGSSYVVGFKHVLKHLENKHYVDAAMAFALLQNVNGIRWCADKGRVSRSIGSGWRRDNETYEEKFMRGLQQEVNKNFRKGVLCDRKDVFNETEIPMGTKLPKTTWGLVVSRNGEAVIRL